MEAELIFCAVLICFALLHLAMIFVLTSGLFINTGGRKSGFHPALYPERARTGTGSFTPMISVIIPVRNESGTILSCLESIHEQDYPGDRYEVIVSDDHSEDYTLEKVRKWGSEHPGLNLVILECRSNQRSELGKKKAIERAVEKSRGEIILATDADTERGSSWITSMVRPFARNEIKMVLGPVCFNNEKGMFGKIQSLEFLGIMGVTAGSAGLGRPLMCNGANLAYLRSSFKESGGYGENIRYVSGDDQFLMMKFGKLYGKRSFMFIREPGAVVQTEPSRNWSDFWSQRLRWVSKSRAYRDPLVIITGLITVLYPLLILAGGITGIFFPEVLILSVALWFVKILVEYPMVAVMAGFFGKKQILSYYFASQAFQFFYSIAAGIGGQFSGFSWKGRTY